jgi:hypothetical protein
MPLNFDQRNVGYLSDSLSKNLDLATVQRGWELYRKQAAISLQQLGSLLKSRVRDDSLHEISLDSDFFEISSCSCLKKRNCEHMAAAFFLLLELNGNQPESFLLECQSTAATRPAETKPAGKTIENPVKKFAEKPAAALMKPAPAPKSSKANSFPKSTDASDSWLHYFEIKFGKPFLVPQLQLGQLIERTENKLIPFADQWPPDLQKIYHIFILLFFTQKIEQGYLSLRSKSGSYFYYQDQYTALASECIDACCRFAQELDKNKAAEVYPDHMLSIIRFLERHAFPGERTPVDWLGLYRFLWGSILYRPEWAKLEQLRLHQALEVKDLHPKRRDFMISALALFDFVTGEDEQAVARLGKILYAREPYNFMSYMQTRLFGKQWDKLLLWMRFVAPMMKDATPYLFDPFFNMWVEAIDQQEPQHRPPWEDIMISLFPSSYPDYSDYLINKKRYREWVDLSLFYSRSPQDLYRDDLREVDKEDLHLLLPLYTQAAERYILQKNRSSYRMAVKMLSSLQSIYKRLKKLDQWQAYYRHIVNHYSRFRAFQEELAKGKWIS